VAAVLTTLIGYFFSTSSSDTIEGISIFFAIALITGFASATNYMKEKQFLKLHDEIKNEEVSVIRGQYGLSQS
jgi:hypothetical protein